MKLIRKLRNIFIFVLISTTLILAQNSIKKGFKFGVEINESFTKSGSFNNSLGFSFGGFTTINLYTFNRSSVFLKVELNYQKLYRYEIGVKKYYADPTDENWNGLNYGAFDYKYILEFVDFGLVPEYQIKISTNQILGLFLGPSIGFGFEDLISKQLDENVFLDPSVLETDGPHFLEPISMNIGISYYFKSLVIDLRIKNAYMKYYDLSNIFFQVGILL